jgi:hypothetical protein
MGTELLGLCFLEEAFSIFYVSRRSFIRSYIKKRELKRTQGGVWNSFMSDDIQYPYWLLLNLSFFQLRMRSTLGLYCAAMIGIL